jgi:hypothetical protein
MSALASHIVAFLHNAAFCIKYQTLAIPVCRIMHIAFLSTLLTWFEHAFVCIFLRRCSRDEVTNSRTGVYVLATFTNLSFRLVVYCTCWRMLFRSSGGLVGNIAVLSACWNCDVSLFVCVVIIQV